MSASAAQMWDVISGTVSQAGTGLPVVGARVVAKDKDPFVDDVLGEAVTDRHGRYRIEYDPDRFGSPLEKAPDIYVQVYDEQGRLLADTKDAILKEAPSTVQLDILVPAP